MKLRSALAVLAFVLCFAGIPARAEEGGAPGFRDWGGSLSLQFPHFFFLELEHRYSKTWEGTFGFGGLNLKWPNGQNPFQAGIGAADFRARWHPYDGAFFLGLALGGQTLSATGTDTIFVSGYGNMITNLSLKIKSSYLSPHFGWNWFYDGGFLLGVDIGWQVPFAISTETAITSDQTLTAALISALEQTPQYQALDANVKKGGDQIGKASLPFVTVFRLGWMF